MEMAELTELQKQVFERFRKHTALIAPGEADVSEKSGSGPDGLGWGDVLELDLRSRDGSGCPFSAMVGDGMALVTIGRGQLDCLGVGSGTEEPLPDMIEQDLLAVVRGYVKETEWRLGPLRLQIDTLLKDESGRWVHLHSWGLPFLGPFWHLLSRLSLVSEHTIFYEPYV